MPAKSAKQRKRAERLGREFSGYWGDDGGRLAGWQQLCEDVGIGPRASVTQCKKALTRLNINLVDLVEAKRRGTTPQHFPSRQALRIYIQNDRSKIFPKDAAKNNGFLKALLIDIFA